MSQTTPEVPGQTVKTPFLRELRSRVRDLVGVSNFPGAQPISFSSVHLQELKNENYFVCEKTDGTRVLVYITYDNSVQQVFLIDRKNYYRLVQNLYFPINEDPTSSEFHYETLIDGELVNDIESDGSITLRLLTFDLLVIDGKNLMSRPLTNRLGYLKDRIIKPYKAMASRRPDLVKMQPFIIDLKKMEFSYGLDKVLKSVIPNLKHKSDGLIFTSSVSGYKTGTFDKMLKWKPPNENSIDFQLHIDFHNNDDDVKPRFCLYKWIQNNDHAYFADMYVTDEEWESFWKDNYNQYDGRIVEVVYDPTINPHVPWRFLRLRNDKQNANHHTVVEKIKQSIMDGITEEQLLSHIPTIRDAWKKRENKDKPKLKHEREDEGEDENPKKRYVNEEIWKGRDEDNKPHGYKSESEDKDTYKFDKESSGGRKA